MKIESSLMLLSKEVLNELGTWCCTDTTLDGKTIERRVEHEGVSFLTITLPEFAADLEKGLKQMKADPEMFPSFRKHQGLPRFLGGFLDQVFDRQSGIILENPNIDAIFAVRQICLLHKKIEIDCSEERTNLAIDEYLQCEKEVKRYDNERTALQYEEFSKVSQLLWAPILNTMDRLVYSENKLYPKHGPGATAEGIRGNSKYRLLQWPQRLERAFPFLEYGVPSASYREVLDQVDFLEPGAETAVRLIPVPKTLKRPRLIAIEPVCMMYMQQAMMEPLVSMLENSQEVSGMIGFLDQTINQRLAKQGSIYGDLATLDLSEASDRVSNQLVREMLKFSPNFAEGVDACRSRKVDVPGHGVTRLAKFASMGSALCFPLEAMVFTTIIFLGIQKAQKRPLRKRDIKSLKRDVRVYGDDIIVPVKYVQSVIRELEAFGLKVNTNKSFWTGKFRESCGGDYYDGVDVTPVRVKQLLPTSRKCVTELVATVALRNRMYYRGLWRTSAWLDKRIEKLIPFPTVLPTSPALGRNSFLGYQPERVEKTGYQRPVVKAAIPVSRPPESLLEGYPALLKFFLKQGREPFADPKHLERTGRPDCVGINIRWVSAV